MVGKILAERYELIEKIAEGGMAKVFRGRDLLLKRTVAVKVLKDQMTGDAGFVRRFKREAQSAAALSHPNIVNIFDVGEDDGTYFMVMEFVDGKNLKEYIREKGRLPVPEAAYIARQIAEALEQAHAAGVVHRDIKPQNILFPKDGKVKVTDFGIAIAGDGATLTVGDHIIGSVQYISPEQARGGLAGKQSDLYSLGIVLYEMVTGKVPYDGESPVAVAMKHIQEPIVPPRHLVSSIPEPLERIILKAVQKDPSLRYVSARKFLEDLLFGGPSETPQAALPYVVKHTDDDDDDLILRPSNEGAAAFDYYVSPKKSRTWLKLLILLLFLALMVTGSIYILNTYVIVPEIAVPEVVGLSRDDAAQILTEAGLVPNPEIILVYHDEIDMGYVVRTEPAPGRAVRRDRVINMFISQGPQYIITPDLTERTEREAEMLLRDLGLTMVVIREYNDEVPEGLVFRQLPGELFRISQGEEVIVHVSLGRSPFLIANLLGFSEAAAIDYLEENGLRPRVRYQPTIGFSGHVVDQFPAAGQEVRAGQSVDIVVGQ